MAEKYLSGEVFSIYGIYEKNIYNRLEKERKRKGKGRKKTGRLRDGKGGEKRG